MNSQSPTSPPPPTITNVFRRIQFPSRSKRTIFLTSLPNSFFAVVMRRSRRTKLSPILLRKEIVDDKNHIAEGEIPPFLQPFTATLEMRNIFPLKTLPQRIEQRTQLFLFLSQSEQGLIGHKSWWRLIEKGMTRYSAHAINHISWNHERASVRYAWIADPTPPCEL